MPLFLLLAFGAAILLCSLLSFGAAGLMAKAASS